MRKTYTLIVMLAMLFVGANSVSAQREYTDANGVKFSIDGTKATVIGYTGGASSLSIPTIFEDDMNMTDTVSGIAATAFAGNTTITHIDFDVFVSGNKINLEKGAFKGCTALKELHYGTYAGTNTVRLITSDIPESCFEGCTAITQVSSIFGSTKLEKNAFKDCTALTSASLGASFLSFGESAFENCTNLATVSCSNSSNTYTLYTRAFKNCTSLTQVGPTSGTVRLGTNLANQEEVFMGCTSITKLGYRYGGTKIGARWFKDCTSLATLSLVNAAEVGESAFEGCTAIKGFNVTANQTASASTLTIGKNAFKGCTAITYAQFDQVKRVTTAIPEGMFEGCTSLASVTSASNTSGSATVGELNGITSIGARAFYGCTALTGYGITSNVVKFLDDLTEIGDSAFAGCSSLGTFRLYKMDAAPTLGEGAFTGIKAKSYFYIYPTNSYTAADKYALDDNWKVFFNGTKGAHYLIAYVNKSKQYGTVSCAVPLSFYATTTAANIYKVTAADDAHSYLSAVSSRKLPANTGAIVEMVADGEAFKTNTAVQVLFSTVSATDWSDNLLVANVTENPDFVGNVGNTWNLIMNDGKFVKANDGTLAAGLAYLPMTFEGGEAKELSLTTDEPTGIKTIDNGEPTVDNGAWYTIDGTRLQGEPTTKGIYVRGGKKVVVK